MTAKLTTFPLPTHLGAGDFRVANIDGNPWFVSPDACRALGMDTRKGTFKWLTALGADEKRTVSRAEHPQIFRGSFASSVALVSESGFYKLVLRSNKPDAKAFQDWVTRDVLPTIRRDGVYVVGEEKLNDPGLTLSELEALGNQIRGLRPG